ncbi:hypothetical protein RHGRI_011904 [Rhododendron griersonianum]|uniref:F-box domain-containing protein n=1 Tax=Rhododendron griersonianum TaxID=479676 RepID=A0AAV6KPS9_9ERIC|nr:hypothetical protein RHGRI_011904 [Rhododendron griersonianum]
MAAESSRSKNQQFPKQTPKKQLEIPPCGELFKLPDLPQELIIEILLQLPVKSLVRFRSVCKSWCTIIYEPQFVKKHLSLVTKDDNINNWRVIIRYQYHDLKSCSLRSFFHEPYGRAVDLYYPFKTLRRGVGIVGSCDGLVCIYYYEKSVDNFYIWNPSTRESHILPSFGEGANFGFSYGFGYDSFNDDYKVIRVAFAKGPLEVKVYSLKTDSWRRIGGFPSNLIMFRPMESSKLVNGSIHWSATNLNNNSWVIIALDLGEETYREIPKPDFGKFGKECSLLSVRALRGCLCALCEYAFSFDVWVMNEYGRKESWTKLISMPYLPEPQPIRRSRPLWYMKDGGVLVNLNGVFVLYDLVDHTLKHPLICGIHYFHQADVYVESLVSPNAFKNMPTYLNE